MGAIKKDNFSKISFHDGDPYHIETNPLICSAHIRGEKIEAQPIKQILINLFLTSLILKSKYIFFLSNLHFLQWSLLNCAPYSSLIRALRALTIINTRLYSPISALRAFFCLVLLFRL